MGNVVAVDIGIVILRCTLFDRRNDLFPYKVIKQRQQQFDFASQAAATCDGTSASDDQLCGSIQNKKLQVAVRSYFMVDYSFYSKEHGGTFHFLQFNIMRTQEVRMYSLIIILVHGLTGIRSTS